MALFVPRRHPADQESFPTDPTAVARWLKPLNPVQSSADAQELVRGLRHCNRLHAALPQRRHVLALLMPALRALEAELLDGCRAQPLPLSAAFRRAARMLDMLLREQSHALKIIVLESDTPAPDDLRQTLQALLKRAEFLVLGYRQVPGDLLAEAFELYRLIEVAADADPDTHRKSTTLFIYLQLLCVIDTRAMRLRQLPAAMALLRQQAQDSSVTTPPSDVYNSPAHENPAYWCIDLRHGARPAPLGSLIIDDPAWLRNVDITGLCEHLEAAVPRAPAHTSFLRGADVLERATLARMSRNLLPGHGRQGARHIDSATMSLIFGIRAIAAALTFPRLPDRLGDPTADATAASAHWQVLNRGTGGAALWSDDTRAGDVQVGDLVALCASADPAADPPGSGAGPAPCHRLASIRHVTASAAGRLEIGVEWLPGDALTVTLDVPAGNAAPVETAILIEPVDDALAGFIVVPAFCGLGGTCIATTADGPEQVLDVGRCLLANGLFSLYEVHVQPPANVADHRLTAPALS